MMHLGQRLNAVMKAQLPMRVKGVLWVLARRANDRTGECWTSMKRLADDAGCSVSVAQRAVEVLHQLGLATAIRHPRRVTHFIVDLRAVRLNGLGGQIERLNPPLNLAKNPQSKRMLLSCISCKKLFHSRKSPKEAICRPCQKLRAADRAAPTAGVLRLWSKLEERR